jgi:hypothetical protein
MSTQHMPASHQPAAPWEWLLGTAQVTRVAAAKRPRWLSVTDGQAWLTQSGAGPHAADVWLQAGQRHLLPAGTEWVVEGWPQARVVVLEAPPPRLSGAAARWRAWPPALGAV